MEDGEVELAVAHAVLGGLPEQDGGAFEIGLASGALCVEDGKVVHRLHVAGVGGADVPALRGVEILRNAEALLVDRAEAILGGRESRFGGALVPLHRLGHILFDAAAFRVARGNLERRRRIAGHCRLTQPGRAEVQREQRGVRIERHGRRLKRRRIGFWHGLDRGRLDVVDLNRSHAPLRRHWRATSSSAVSSATVLSPNPDEIRSSAGASSAAGPAAIATGAASGDASASSRGAGVTATTGATAGDGC